MDTVKYLGCDINQDGNIRREVSKRISNSMTTFKKLDIFWRHSNCPTKFKIIALDAVVRSKLMYGLNTAQLNENEMKRLDIFQLKGLRKIMKKDTTYVNRANTNERIFEMANEQLKEEHGNNNKKEIKKIIPFRKAYLCSKLKRLKRIINQDQSNPCRKITFRENLTVWTQPNRLQWRPKIKWTDKALKEQWEQMKEEKPEIRHITLYSNYYHRLLTPEAHQHITDFARTNENT